MHPGSNTSRPILLFIAENRLPIEQQGIDLMTGEHLKMPCPGINPNGLVPALVDGDFILTESSSILKYLADRFDLPSYPKDLKARARVNELMDWFNAGFYRDYGYGVVYPQVFPHHKRPTDEMRKGTIEWGKGLGTQWLRVLNDHWLGHGNKYLAGDTMTIADIFGAALLTSGHVIRDEFKDYPNIQAWLKRMEELPNWKTVNQAMEGFRAHVKDQPFVQAFAEGLQSRLASTAPGHALWAQMGGRRKCPLWKTRLPQFRRKSTKRRSLPIGWPSCFVGSGKPRGWATSTILKRGWRRQHKSAAMRPRRPEPWPAPGRSTPRSISVPVLLPS